MSNASTQPSLRKTFALKRADAEPLTREDIQYDLLEYIFDDQKALFTDPNPSLNGDPPGSKVTFRDLYVNALIKSTRSSKVIREKAVETPEFGTDFAKISLLTNVGRINTTMAFFPEMRTSLRTYHPIPSLQKTDGNLQDAPRIKNTLKACLLESEARQPPTTPIDILMKRDAGLVPSTSIVNLLFVMAHHSAPIGRTHLPPSVDFQDIFLPGEYTSRSRSNVFLWLCYHYLEPFNTPNPFADEYCQQNPSKAPYLAKVTTESIKENVDPPEETEWGAKMAEQRRKFLIKNAQETKNDAVESGSSKTEKESRSKQEKHTKIKETNFVDSDHERPIRANHSLRSGVPSTRSKNTHPQHPSITMREAYAKSEDSISRRSPGETVVHPPTKLRRMNSYHERATMMQERSMLQHAWHIVSTTDPLVDSDEENADEHVRLDYTRRLQTLKRLRGKSPTPEAEFASVFDAGGIRPLA